MIYGGTQQAQAQQEGRCLAASSLYKDDIFVEIKRFPSMLICFDFCLPVVVHLSSIGDVFLYRGLEIPFRDWRFTLANVLERVWDLSAYLPRKGHKMFRNYRLSYGVERICVMLGGEYLSTERFRVNMV